MSMWVWFVLVFIGIIVKPYFVICSWVWICDINSGLCNRTSNEESINFSRAYSNHELCRLTCGNEGIVWPKPSSMSIDDSNLVNIDVENVTFQIKSRNDQVRSFLEKVIEYFKEVYKNDKSATDEGSNSCDDDVHKLLIRLNSEENDTNLSWDTNEQYDISIKTNGTEKQMVIIVKAPTVFGIRHGIETILQLINENEISTEKICHSTIKKAKIFDKPFYKHRGLLLDTARNFLTTDIIKKNIIALGMTKMNVLHWHITDTQSFPFVSNRVPDFSRYGAYSEKETYHSETIKDLIEFAKFHGVRIIPEIDGPAHAGNGWQWGPNRGYGNLVACYEWQPWRSYCIQPPCGQLNPINSNLYRILGLLYADILYLWPEMEAFHMGGDEVYIPCWNSTQEIIDYLGPEKRSEADFVELWGSFQEKAVQAFDSYATKKNTSMILWTSTLTDIKYVKKYLLPSRYVIQSWEPSTSTLPDDLLKLGYKLIISTKDKWYLDHGFWGVTTFDNWRKVYENQISPHEGVLGGEVCSWGELVDDSEAEPRVWPRASAAAERLWSNPSSIVTSEIVEQRFFLHRERLVNRGIKAAAVTPKYCVQQEGACSGYLN